MKNVYKEKSRPFKVCNKTGMHCRPAASFVKMAQKFKSDIYVEKDGARVNGKSIMGLMMLAAENGATLNVSAVGPDADPALDALEFLVTHDFTLPS
jgi:phosphocarrier protein HPr